MYMLYVSLWQCFERFEIGRPRQDSGVLNICYHIFMFLGISNCFSNMVNNVHHPKMSFIRTPEEINGMETWICFSVSGYDADDCTDRIKENNSSWWTLVAHVWGATCGLICLTDTCSGSWVSFLKLKVKWIVQQCKISYSFKKKIKIHLKLFYNFPQVDWH